MLAAIACGDVFQPDAGGGALRTDRAEYVALRVTGSGASTIYSFTVVATFENATDSTLYLARCYPGTPYPIYYVELLSSNASSESAFSPGWACVGHEQQFAVAPGTVRTDTLHLFGPRAFDGNTGQPFGQLEGVMRLQYEVQGCPGDGACRLPDIDGSNSFRVSLGR